MVADSTHDQVLIKMVLDMNIFSYRKTGQKKCSQMKQQYCVHQFRTLFKGVFFLNKQMVFKLYNDNIFLKNAKDGDVGCPYGTAWLRKMLLICVNDTPIKQRKMLTETRKFQNISRSHVQVAN